MATKTCLSPDSAEYIDGYFPCCNGNERYDVEEDLFNCDTHYENGCWCPQLSADPDIAGPGVIFAFMATAGLTVIAAGICLMLSRVSVERVEVEQADGSKELVDSSTINPIDKYFRWAISDRIQKRLKHPDLWANCLYDMVISLSDQQLATGFAILVSGLIGLGNGSITIYHFSTVTGLAWFSSNTHLLSLLVVHSYADSVKYFSPKRDDPKLRYLSRQAINWIRIILMSSMAILLLFCSWVSAYENWENEYNCPAKCTLGSAHGGKPLMWMRVDFFYVFYNYGPGILSLIRPFRLWWIDRFRWYCIDSRGQPADKGHISFWDMPPKALRYVGIVFRTLWYILASETVSFLEVIYWFISGVYSISVTQRYGHSLMKNPDDEKKLGFGQLVPVFLLVLQIMQFSDSYAKNSWRVIERDGGRPRNVRVRRIVADTAYYQRLE
ncbi:hypothetical protein EDB80DRAFT_777719 [Ilyonectria destructans]|nr:hypothetical protein EDB80DRAFT_777719 [Ilyonectria destructans]